ncbi:MAG: DUF2634 domain-containing protein [Lachnospiraceae bacterium]
MAAISTDLVLERQIYETRTYKLTETKIEGFVDKLEALKQSIYKVLATEQFEYPVYSFSYGIAWRQLIGEERPYVRAEMKRMIMEALDKDDRILEIDGFKFEFIEDHCTCTFDVHSIYGDFDIETEVTV